MTIASTNKTILDFLPELEEALEHAGDTHTPQDVAEMVLRGDAQLWVEGDGLIITEVEEYPNGPVLNIWLAAGDMDDVLSLLPQVYGFGRWRECKTVTTLGRKGWKRVLAEDGWEDTELVYLEREL